MERTIDIDEYKSVGPFPDVGGHGPVTIVGDVSVCLDCGYTTATSNVGAGTFRNVECDRSENDITVSWRERIADRGFPYSFEHKSGDFPPEGDDA